MKISVFGLGYVGCVSAACFAKEGFQVIGVDVNAVKLDIIRAGKSPIIEEGIEDLIKQMVAEKRLTVTDNGEKAVLESDISLVCVGTPSKDNGDLELHYLKSVCKEIAAVLKKKKGYHVIVMRSTIFPGTTEEILMPILEEESGKNLGSGFGLCVNPEFLREGSSIKDFYNPPFTFIGGLNKRDIDLVELLYKGVNAPVVKMKIREAEMLKYVSNTFHGLKVAFANEIGRICKSIGIDSHNVMSTFCLDTKLNISPAYLKPGFAYGGSCLPKDLRCLQYKGKTFDLELPLLNAISISNNNQINNGIDMVLKTGKKKVGILGFSFKAGTDDLRESPMVILIETLLGKGLELSIYDKNVSISKLMGANKEYIEKEIPHISSLMCVNIDEVINNSDVLVIGNNDKEFQGVLDKGNAGKIIIDLVRIKDDIDKNDGFYNGIGW